MMDKSVQQKLMRELVSLPQNASSHNRRREIGNELAALGDFRSGVAITGSIPDILWLPVAGSNSPVAFSNARGELRGYFRIKPFLIAKYPITFSQYKLFADTEYTDLRWWEGFPGANRPYPLAEAKHQLNNVPRDNISWYQAVAFARWIDQKYRMNGWFEQVLSLSASNHEIRLPTEWEWQWTAQNGSEARMYPWGNWQDGYTNTCEANLGGTIAVGMYPHGAAQCGALDMTGNTCEWCLNKVDGFTDNRIDDSGDKRVLRGGSHFDESDMGQTTFRFGDDTPDVISGLNGFRLVVAPKIAT